VKAVFWTFSIICISIKFQCFESWIFFRLQVKRKRQKTYLMGHLVELVSELDSFNIEMPGA
jgi:hypothetical protein